jgi:hypothetical protein
MSVRPEYSQTARASLTGADGELVTVSIAAAPRLLEALLEALSELPFPVNPEIYHHGGVTRVYPDGRRETDPAVIVDFPAYAGNLGAVRSALEARDFPPESAWARNILEQIHCEDDAGPAPEGAPYVSLVRRRRLVQAA